MNKRKIKRYDSNSISLVDAKNMYVQIKVAKGVTKLYIDSFHFNTNESNMNILVKGNHLSGELETVCPGRRKPVYMRRSR